MNAQNTRFVRLNTYIGVIPALIGTLANYSVIVLGVWLVIRAMRRPRMLLEYPNKFADAK